MLRGNRNDASRRRPAWLPSHALCRALINARKLFRYETITGDVPAARRAYVGAATPRLIRVSKVVVVPPSRDVPQTPFTTRAWNDTRAALPLGHRRPCRR